MSYSISRIDTCLPCYFQGTSMPLIQVAVDGSTTKNQLKEMLIDEVKTGFIQNEDELPKTDNVGKQTEAIVKAIEEWCEKQPINPFPTLDCHDDDDGNMDFDSVYAYFIISFDE